MILIPRSSCVCNNNNGFNDNCNNNGFGNNNNCCCSSTWGNWGRWVLLAGLVILFLVFAVGFACLNSRRRRRSGLAPRYGTGWAAGKPPGGQFNYNNQGNAAPPYSAPPPVYGNHTGNTFNSNEGYYGQQNGQQTGIELQQPQQSYQPYQEPAQYAPPTGAPPAKN